nr:hypothetical protein Iba_chr07cCG11420 [Ipomoea batatas]GMD19505.1 hypothetical protein Iba_chr07eCG8880 [Ipomoea batatas]
MEVWNLPTGHCCRCLTGAMETGRQHGSETAMEMTSRTHGGVAAGGVTDSRRAESGERLKREAIVALGLCGLWA